MTKLNREIPEIFREFKNQLVSSWNEYDVARREKILSQGKSYYYSSNSGYDWGKFNEFSAMKSLTDDKIFKRNEDSAISLINSLINRVEKKVGNVKNFAHLYVTKGNFLNDGGEAINGYIEGETGKCEVRSILAAGPVQRLHVRVLVKSI